jgi:hypothetical protein
MKTGARLTSTSTPSASDLNSDAETDWLAVTAALAACNANRLAGAREIRRLELTLWFSLAALFITALVIAYRNGSGYFATIAFAISFLVLAAIQSVTDRQRRRLQGDAYRVLLPSVLSRIDDLVIEFGQASDSIERLPGHYFLPRQKARHDLVVTGRWNGLVFSVSQSQFTRPAGDDRDEITFWGVIVCVELKSVFPGDFAALQRPEKARSLLRQTTLPDQLQVLYSEATEQRGQYEFVSTAPDAAETRLGRMLHALDALRTLPLDGVAQIGVRNGDAFLLLPFGNAPLAFPDVLIAIDIERDLKSLRDNLSDILQAAQAATEI